jgi:hypothetical protein
VNDAISAYRAATEAGDVDRAMELISPDAELVSPVSGTLVIRGKPDLRRLFETVYGSLTGLTWTDQVSDDRVGFLRGEARIGPFRLGDAMVFELDADGRIVRIRPHIRPWLGLSAFAAIVGAKIAFRHPGLLIRAIR